LENAQDEARSSGYRAKILTTSLQGEARGAAHYLADEARRVKAALGSGERLCLLSCGETTVTVRGRGIGGRNQELALAFALEIDGEPGITLLAAGTDGIDGPTNAAGAVVDGFTAARGRSAGMDPASHLAENDSHTFFRLLDERIGTRTLLVTGPTGTNVADIQLILIERPRGGA
jgi:glycerate-2-kinase